MVDFFFISQMPQNDFTIQKVSKSHKIKYFFFLIFCGKAKLEVSQPEEVRSVHRAHNAEAIRVILCLGSQTFWASCATKQLSLLLLGHLLCIHGEPVS